MSNCKNCSMYVKSGVVKYCSDDCRILFNSKLDKESGCWIWTGYFSMHRKLKYGMTSSSRCKSMLSHRLSYETFIGHIKPKELVCHKCNNSLCVNPNHLYVGDHFDNARDRMKAGNYYSPETARCPGEKNGQAVLTESDVKLIRLDTRSLNTIAKSYGVSRSAIERAKHRKTWKHVS